MFKFMNVYEKINNKWILSYQWNYIDNDVNGEYVYIIKKCANRITRHIVKTICGVLTETFYIDGEKIIFFEN